MKYRYIIIFQDGDINGLNKLNDNTAELFDYMGANIIDCKHGEIMTKSDPEEWENIYLYTGDNG